MSGSIKLDPPHVQLSWIHFKPIRVKPTSN